MPELKASGADVNQGSGQDVSLSFPPDFLCGMAINVYQNSGDPNTNWAWFEQQKKAKANLRFRLSLGSPDDKDGLDENHGGILESRYEGAGPPVIQKGYKIGISSDFWNRYEEDIQLAQDLGSNSFRLSLEWSRIVPRRGEVDQSAVDHYHQIFDALDKRGMQVNVTLFWFVLPKWFMDMGGFEKEENIAEFVEWGRLAFQLFGKRSKMWATINEPGVHAMCGYVAGNHPPGKLAHFKMSGTVLLNELRGHRQIYDAIKGMPGGKECAVGIVHNVFWLEPKGDGLAYSHVKGVLKLANRIWANEVVFNYLKTGKYEYQVNFRKNVTFEEPSGRPGCDFIGVNHYARAVVNWALQPDKKDGDGALTDMDYPVYPPSLYRSISYASTLGVPIYIMENGIPGGPDDPKRKDWIVGCLNTVKRAIDDGFDVRGFMYWTLIDNFEWNFAWILQFGLYQFVPSKGNPSGKRVMKQGTEALAEWYRTEGPKLTEKLKARGEKAPAVKSDRERQKLEEHAEWDFLREQGVDEKNLPALTSQADPAEYTVNGENYQHTRF